MMLSPEFISWSTLFCYGLDNTSLDPHYLLVWSRANALFGWLLSSEIVDPGVIRCHCFDDFISGHHQPCLHELICSYNFRVVILTLRSCITKLTRHTCKNSWLLGFLSTILMTRLLEFLSTILTLNCPEEKNFPLGKYQEKYLKASAFLWKLLLTSPRDKSNVNHLMKVKRTRYGEFLIMYERQMHVWFQWLNTDVWRDFVRRSFYFRCWSFAAFVIFVMDVAAVRVCKRGKR